MSGSEFVSRRDLIRGAGAALAAATVTRQSFADSAPTSPVAVARCRSYGREFELALDRSIDQIGGIGDLVRGKTVAIKPNLTGGATNNPPRPEMPFRTEPSTLLAVATLIARNGASRIRIIEGFFPVRQEMDGWAAYGLDVNAITNVGCPVEWENTNHLGKGVRYERLAVPYGGYIFPAFDLNHSYLDCDVYISLAKLKNHWLAGLTMSLKNNFGITPASLYGGDAGPNGNESPTRYRGTTLHQGTTPVAQGVPQEHDPQSPREAWYRIPRIVSDLAGARPIDLSIVDGVSTIRGGEGPWNPGVQWVKPGVLIVGHNPVCTDTVSTAVMGYDPRAPKGSSPFVPRDDYEGADNTLLLAEAAGLGSADLSQIEVAGLTVEQARFDFGPGPVGYPIEVPGAPLAALSAARESGMLAPGSIVSLYGRRISPEVFIAGARGQTELNGVRVEVTDSDGGSRLAELGFISANQANIVLSDLTAPGLARIALRTSSGEVLESAERIFPVAPGVFTADGSGNGVAAAYAVRDDAAGERHWKLVFDCAADAGLVSCAPEPVDLGAEGDATVLVLYGTGIRHGAGNVRAWVDDEPATVLWSGKHAEFSGLDQVNVLLDRSLAGRGLIEVLLEVDGEPSNPVLIAV